jgi:hypothetical protein
MHVGIYRIIQSGGAGNISLGSHGSHAQNQIQGLSF